LFLLFFQLSSFCNISFSWLIKQYVCNPWTNPR
jgi:hypothetical protein